MAKRWFVLSLLFLLAGAAPSSAEPFGLMPVNAQSSDSSFRMVSAVQANDPALRMGYRLGGRVDQELPTTNQRQLRIFIDDEPRQAKKNGGVFISPDVGSLRQPEFTMSVGITW